MAGTTELAAYATSTELAAFWRPLSADETARADTVLAYASNMLRQTALNRGVNLDVKISNDETGVLISNVKMVVMEATKRAMVTPVDQQPVNSQSMGAGPYTESLVFTNPSGDIWFTKAELSRLGLRKQSIGSLSVSRRDIY